MRGSPKALFLTHTAPLPLVSGERIRTFHLMRELDRQGWDVSLFSLLHSVPLGTGDEELLGALCDDVLLVPFQADKSHRYMRLARAMATGHAFQETYFYSSGAAQRLRAELPVDDFDALVPVTLYMYPYVPTRLHHRTALDTLNVDARRIEAMAKALARKPRGLVARAQLPAVRRFEAAAATSVARVIAVSPEEQRAFDDLAPGRVDLVPNGVDCDALRARETLPAEPSLLFVGSMDYGANVDAVEHLVDEVLPLLEHRETAVTIVGSNPPRSLAQTVARSQLPIDLAGFVPETGPFFERSRLFVVPLRFGGGTRLKILEALARGAPVVTTSIGCEGLDLVHERDVIIADHPSELASWIDRLLDDDDLCRSLARQGRATVEEHYDWRRIGTELARSLEMVAS
ncbi:MAG: glycosyltransferase [Actinobacteria bacterium]|nr:glycosyltransferase [Actinomycetota bacterium]